MRLPTPREPRVQHDPDLLALVEADLDEVVAGAERAEMIDVVACDRACGYFVDDRVVAALQLAATRVDVAAGGFAPGAACRSLPPLSVRPCGTAFSIAVRTPCRLSGRSLALQRGLHRHHAAADVDADRRRDDRALGRDHAADGRADAPMHVRHRRHPLVDERQLRDVAQLLVRRRLDGTPFVQALMGTPFSASIN